MEDNLSIQERFEALDSCLDELQQQASQEAADFGAILQQGVSLCADILHAYASSLNKPMPVSEDLLELQKALVKGDPSLTAVRDNVRELVYYQNCLSMGREDALPAQATRMVVHTTRHVYLYLRSRCEQEGALD